MLGCCDFTFITENLPLILLSLGPAALHKDMGSCRAATITGTLSRISLNDEEDEKGPEGLNYSTLPGNIISKVIIQQPSALHMSMGMGELKEQCITDSNADMRRAVYLCTDDAMRQSDQNVGGHELEGHPGPGQMMETDYIVMPRASAAVGSSNMPTLIKDDTKMNITMDTLPHDRLMHYKMSPDFNISPSGLDHMNVNLEQQYPGAPEPMQNLPFEPRTAVKNFLAEMEESAGLSRSETGSTISMSSLEVHEEATQARRGAECRGFIHSTLYVLCSQRRKSRYSDLDFEVREKMFFFFFPPFVSRASSFFSTHKIHLLQLCLSFDLLVLVVPLKLIGLPQHDLLTCCVVKVKATLSTDKQGSRFHPRPALLHLLHPLARC